MNNHELAEEILQLLGGQDNILSLGHCYTRIRLQVKDDSLCEIERLNGLEDVLGVVTEGNSIQVILGPGKSSKVDDELVNITHITSQEYDEAEVLKAENKAKNNTPWKNFLKKIANVFYPIIPAFIGCGLMAAIYESACVFVPGFDESTFGHILSAIAYSVFNILPIICGYNAAREFGGSPIIGAVLAAVLNSDAITGVTLFGVELLSGRGGVISVLIVVICGAYFERWLRKYIPDMFETFLTPLITIFVMTFLGLLVFQPLGGFVSNAIGSFVSYIIYNVPALAGLATLVYLPLVVSGMHHGLIAVNAALIADFGVTYLLPVTCMAGAGQVGAAFYVLLKTKNPRLKRTCINALPIGMLGIGEPLLWGVTIPLGRPFLASCLGGAIGGSCVAMMHVAALIPELSGLQLALITDAPLKYLLGILISYVCGFVICAILGFDDPTD